MGALIELNVNTNGLAKLAETVFHGLGITAYGNKKVADAEAYATIKRVETEAKVEILKLKNNEEVANYLLAN